MKKGLIGVQMMVVKDKVNELGVYEVMKRLAEIGFHSVEISQIAMTAENIAAFRKACDDFNMAVSSSSAYLEPDVDWGVPMDYLTTDYDKIVSDCKALNCKMLRIGMLPFSSMGSFDKIVAFAKRADAMAKKLKTEHDIDYYFHAHHLEFVKYDGKLLIDIMRDNTQYLGYELDTYWMQAGGVYPVDFIKTYAGRVKLLHLKDYRIAEVHDINDFYTLQNFQFAEVGEGNLPMKACIEAGLASGAEYFLIEQDDTYGRDPFDSLKISHDNLVKMGFADWFAIN